MTGLGAAFGPKSPSRLRIQLAFQTTISLITASSLLGGCAVGPDYQTPFLALPGQWGNANAVESTKPPKLNHWWQRLRDPLLNQIVEEAVAGNLDVASAKARIREARATYRQTRGALFPSLDETASATRSKSPATTGAGTIYNLFQAGFDASWELDLFGGSQRATEAALYGWDAAEEDLRATLLTLIGDVTSTYAEARGYQARIALAKRTAASQRETANLTRTQFEAGASSAVDVANAVGLAASTEANIPTLETSYAEAVHRLGVLTGQAPTALAARLKRSMPIPIPRLPTPTGLPANILCNRPDVRHAERQLAQYTAKIGQAEANRYPSVTLTGQITTSAYKLGDLGKSSSIGWSFGPSLTVPIFNGGQLQAAVDIAEAQRDQYFAAYHSAVLAALEDVENAIVSLAQERIRKGKLTESVNSYREAASLSRKRYQSGTASFLDVLDAERSLYSAEDTLLQSQIAIAVDYIALNKALGGGWDDPIDVSRPEVVDVGTGLHLAYRE